MSEHRVWRMRRRQLAVDAELHIAADGTVDVRFFQNGTLTYSKHCATREEAMAEATAKRSELERAGWIFHW